MVRRHRFSARLRAPAHPAGFTLVELLVASAVGSLIVITASLILGPYLRSNQRMEAYIRLQERWIRVAYLLDTEVQTARAVEASGNTLTLTLPFPRNDGSLPSVVYSLATAANGSIELRRNGPPIDDWGLLDPNAGPTPELLVAGVAANGFRPSLEGSSTLSMNYVIDLIDPGTNSTYTGRGSVARGKADCDSLESDDGDCIGILE